MAELKCKRQVHKGYTEWHKMNKANPEITKSSEMLSSPMFAKWQYIYEYHGESFSLIKFSGYLLEFAYKDAPWEVLCPDDDVRRFKTKREAEEYIVTNY